LSLLLFLKENIQYFLKHIIRTYSIEEIHRGVELHHVNSASHDVFDVLTLVERLTVQIRDCIDNALHPLGVAVVIEAMHTCMSIRGVQKANATTTTSAFSGAFLTSARTRNEFLNLIK
jgi:GTP cyclohydrolase I